LNRKYFAFCEAVAENDAEQNQNDSASCMTVERLFEIIFEDSDLLVLNKPAGLVCHPTKTDAYSSLISRARLHLGPDSHPQLVNRLDRETSGVTLIAKTADAARELRKIWESRQVEKEYLAIVHGHVLETSGMVDAPLGKDQQSRVAIKDCVRADGAPARTEFWVARRLRKPEATSQSSEVKPSLSRTARTAVGLRDFSVLRIRLHTGRKHQVRIHLAHIGHPIVGDKLYGGDEDLYLALVENRLTPEQQRRLLLPNQALHAATVRFHWRNRPVEFCCEPETWFREFVSSPKNCPIRQVREC